MKQKLLLLSLLGSTLLFANEQSMTPQDLFSQKCSACHSMQRPSSPENVIAPALNGVMRHLKMRYPNQESAVAFIKDYVLNPSQEKAICMPQKIQRFGLMPSQKGNVTTEELTIIANWMFEHYPQQEFKGHNGFMKHQGRMMK
jgi:cytochrome c